MKANRAIHPFVPVELVLESQAEVDAIFTLLNHTQISAAVKLPIHAFECLDAYKSLASEQLHSNLNALIQNCLIK